MPGPRKNAHRWTEEERLIVQREYTGRWESVERLAHKLGVSRYAVKGQVARLGLGRQDRGRPWTPEEDAYLREHINSYSVGWIARQLRRSLNAVTIRARRIGARRRYRDGWYTKQDVCHILGVDHRWVQRRIESGKLRASFHNERRPQQGGSAMWHISEASLRKYIVDHPEELTGRNVDLMVIVDLLAHRAAGREIA